MLILKEEGYDEVINILFPRGGIHESHLTRNDITVLLEASDALAGIPVFHTPDSIMPSMCDKVIQ